MTLSRAQRISLAVTALLFSTLACRAATRLIIPDTPTVPPPTQTAIIPNTPIPTLPPSTPTAIFQSACPALLADIMQAATTDSNESDEFKDEEYYVLYTVEDNELDARDDIHFTDKITTEQDSRATHEFIWNYFAAIIPQEQRDFITEFAVASDGKGEILAAVSPTYDDTSKWKLEVDILDSEDNYNLTFTLMHEFGHLLTLNVSQAPINNRVFFSPNDDAIYEKAVTDCPQYFTGEGCSNSDSYINEFFNRFWTDLYEEWQVIDLEEDDDIYYDELDDFYRIYHDQFVTDYASTSPEEDIAESWSFFVLSPKPELNSIANEKILFFYEYPELAQLRQDILNRVCVSFPQ